MSDREQERLKRLREQQLQTRDPLTKQRKIQHGISVKERRAARKPFSFAKAWSDIPHIFKVPFYGLLLGVTITFILPMLWISPYAIFAGAGVTLLLIVFGAILGNTLDLRDRIKDNIK
ncbi:MAG: hypothetical protein QY328_13170 [Anaerolineales bacterium]|nr:hypothetical protein [Anaerolineales bacterium]WKZ39210.1 MAG: hypothetical protein QY328_13170 [Anaerolineales bacterium]